MLAPFELNVSRGLVPEHRDEFISAEAIVNTTANDLWPLPNDRIQPIVETRFTLVSTSAQDSASGTGIRALVLRGLNAKYEEVVETVLLNGTTPVFTANKYIRFRRAIASVVGSAGVAIGTITINSGSNIQGQIAPGDGVTLGSHFTVPKDSLAFLKHITITGHRQTGGGDLDLAIDVYTRSNGGPIIRRIIFYIDTSPNTLDMLYFPMFRPGTDFWLKARTAKGVVNISAIVLFILVGSSLVSDEVRSSP